MRAYLQYLARRMVQVVPTLLGVAAALFFLFHAFGPDPALTALGPMAKPESLQQLRAAWGLDQPLSRQALTFAVEILTLDFGRAFGAGEHVSQLIREGLWVSLALTAPPFALGLVANFLLAVGAVRRVAGPEDQAMMFLSACMMSVSGLVIVMLAQEVFAFRLDWFPLSGIGNGSAVEAVQHLLLPWMILAVIAFGPDFRLFRGLLLEQMRSDYVRTARAKGLDESRVIGVHVFANILAPVLSHTLQQVPWLFMGSFVLERYFSLPGIGDLYVGALGSGDWPVLKAMTVMGTLALLATHLLADLLSAHCDPRIQLQ